MQFTMITSKTCQIQACEIRVETNNTVEELHSKNNVTFYQSFFQLMECPITWLEEIIVKVYYHGITKKIKNTQLCINVMECRNIHMTYGMT